MTYKQIVIDAPVKEFLSELKELRERAGISQPKLAQELNIGRTTMQSYELGVSMPTLGTLIKLAEYFNYDISQSFNYKYFHGEIQSREVKKKLKYYGISNKELSEITGYDKTCISCSIRMTKDNHATLACLAAVLKVIEQEEAQYKHRQEILQKTRANDTYLTQAHYPHRRRNYA